MLFWPVKVEQSAGRVTFVDTYFAAKDCYCFLYDRKAYSAAIRAWNRLQRHEGIKYPMMKPGGNAVSVVGNVKPVIRFIILYRYGYVALIFYRMIFVRIAYQIFKNLCELHRV